MKFTPEVVAALAVLRNAAENDFERHRLDVLERDLTELPKVEVIDDTHQKFNGMTFHKASDEHYVITGAGIHRFVWSYHHGEIPDGCAIHHIDGDKSNNTVNNLQCLTRSEHRKIHATPIIQTCIHCGKEYIVAERSDNNGYCSSTCRIAHQYRLAENQVIRICAHCGKEFTAYKYSRKKCCSISCAQSLRFKGHSLKKICPVCGKEFETISSKDSVCCSRSCGSKLMWQTARANEQAPLRQCAFCGKDFQIQKATQRFCSKSCAMKYRNKKS